MATVIDSLMVSLGLDSSQFTKGQQESITALKKLEGQSVKSSNEIEKHSKLAAKAFSSLKGELLAIVGLFAGATGLASFTQQTIMQTAALGRMSNRLDMNTQDLAEWELAAKNAGGTSEGMVATLRGASDAMADFALGKQNAMLTASQYWGVDLSQIKNSTDLIMAQSNAIKKARETINPATGKAYGNAMGMRAAGEMGIGESEYQMMSGGSESLRRQLDAQKDLAKAEADMAVSAEVVRKEFDQLGNEIKAKLIPYVQDFAEYLASPQAHQSFDLFIGWIASAAGAVKIFAEAIGFAAAHPKTTISNTAETLASLEPLWYRKLFSNLTKKTGLTDTSILNYVFGNKKENTDVILSGANAGHPAVKSASSTGANAITSKLMATGWTPEQAAGITGSLQQESGKFNPAEVGPTIASGANKGEHGYGIGQWLSPRRADFKKWSGHDIEGSSLDEQIAFMNYELSQAGKYKSAGDALRNAKTASDAAMIHSNQYEIAGKDESMNNKRIAYAKSALNASNTANATNASNLPLAFKSAQSSNQKAGNTTTVDTNISEIKIYTQASDANGIGMNIGSAINKNVNMGIPNANTGQY